ncbi:Fur family transcriptional regulator [uncultured Jatrophihabitans sp.]|uniref:Fur family transcriptional regulator n=1 Tax=uncultured Jatrophihabitans sp. TaxID=1610747 RepID=UPI0035CAE075
MTAHHSHPHDSAHAQRSTQRLVTALRERGMRVTAQREQVLAAVHRLGHATPEQIGEAVDGVDVATVYRTLELLEELGLVRHTHLGHGPASYRPADDQHIHVVCHSCGAVVDAAPDLADSIAERLHADNGFELDRAHFTVFGRCASCAATEAGAGTNPRARTLSQTS